VTCQLSPTSCQPERLQAGIVTHLSIASGSRGGDSRRTTRTYSTALVMTRRLRGALGLVSVWTIAWSTVGLAFGVLAITDQYSPAPSPWTAIQTFAGAFAIGGAACGALFAYALTRTSAITISALRAARVGTLGAGSGAIVAAMALTFLLVFMGMPTGVGSRERMLYASDGTIDSEPTSSFAGHIDGRRAQTASLLLTFVGTPVGLAGPARTVILLVTLGAFTALGVLSLARRAAVT
jgi:hypothetical protein